MIYMFLSNNLSSGDINSLNLSCYDVFLSLKIVFTLTNSLDSDDAFHLGLHSALFAKEPV